MCSDSREWNCWNSFGFNGAIAARLSRATSAITAELYQLDGFASQFTDMVRRCQSRPLRQKGGRLAEALSDEVAPLAAEKENFNNAIKKFGPRDTLLEAAQRHRSP